MLKPWSRDFLKLANIWLLSCKNFDRNSPTIYHLVVVRRPLRSGQTGIAAKWLPPLDWHSSRCRTNVNNYRLEHVETGKLLDPTKVDKVVKVEPWSINKLNGEQLNPVTQETTLLPETPPHHLSAFENGSFIVKEKFGDTVSPPTTSELHVKVTKSQNEHKSSTGQACKDESVRRFFKVLVKFANCSSTHRQYSSRCRTQLVIKPSLSWLTLTNRWSTI